MTLLPSSPPGYFLAFFAAIVIAMQSMVLLDPADTMKQLNSKDPESVRFIGE